MSILININSGFINRDVVKQLYRGDKLYQEQMRHRTERELQITNPKPESEMVRPYVTNIENEGYEQMEYDLLPPSGFGPLPSGDPPSLPDWEISIGEFKVATPSFSPPAGSYDSSQTVYITTTPADADIYYTIDGTEPDEHKTKYTIPLKMRGDTVLKAKAFKDGWEDSAVKTGAYSIALTLVTFTTDSTMYAERWYDYSSENVCEMIEVGTTQLQNQDLNYGSTTKCGLLFYGNVHKHKNFCVLFPNVITANPDYPYFQGAILRVFTGTNSANYRELSFKLYGNDVASAVIPSTYDDFFNKTLTTAYSTVEWADSYSSYESYDFDVTTIINEIISRGDWTSGNDLQILCKDVSGSSLSFAGSGQAEQYRPDLLTYWS